jgi:hypothetical protein
MDWKFLGEKKILAPFHAAHFPVQWCQGEAFAHESKPVTAMIALIGMVVARSVAPAPVCAQDTVEISGIVAGAYTAVVLIGGEIYNRSRGPLDFAVTPPGDFAPDLARVARRPQASGVRRGAQCRQTARGLTLPSWKPATHCQGVRWE